MMQERLKGVHRALGAALAVAVVAPLLAADEHVASVRENGKLRLDSRQAAVVLDEADGVWDATWIGGADVRGVRFAVEADGRPLVPKNARAEFRNFSDAVGSGVEIRQRWGREIEVERCVRLYDDRPAIVVTAQISNNTGRDVTLGAARMLDLSEAEGGSWRLGDSVLPPAAVGFPGASPACRPAPTEESAAKAEQQYGSAGVLALSQRESPVTLVIGCLSAREGEPSIGARFRGGQGGTLLGAAMQLGNRALSAGRTIVLDPVWLSVDQNRYHAMERYGDAVAALAKPVHTGANALWCSWYPIRMRITEEIVLAQAAIAAKHFGGLGFDTIQLDHGWQQGNICGDWIANERFPHGFKWLSEQLQSRYGMKLGLWIAPTYVSFTSQMFRDHPDWLVANADGKPASVGRWYWAPNPETAHLDASHPAAAKWIEETFSRLSSEGVGYYKIDFIAGSPALKQAMEAIRRGAGPNAWIRYTQTPPLLSAGLANSSFIGDDTGDAGLPEWMDLARKNAPLLAASYWANDRLYHREVCDMSVGTKADVEEARFRLSLMTLSGCSASFSDDFRALDLPRIRMMQQCLPPGGPLARPLDLFDRQWPSLWHTHCKNASDAWDVVGLFNFEDQPEERTVELRDLGFRPDEQAVAFEFWTEKLLGVQKGRVSLTLLPHTARALIIHGLPTRPQLIATNMHMLGGYHEIRRLTWNEQQTTLSGRFRRAAGLEGKAFLYVPDGYRVLSGSSLSEGMAGAKQLDRELWQLDIEFKNSEVDWTVGFERAKPLDSQ